MSKKAKSKAYKATKSFSNIVSERMLTKNQYKAMVGGQADELKGISEKRLNYLLVNNLVEEV